MGAVNAMMLHLHHLHVSRIWSCEGFDWVRCNVTGACSLVGHGCMVWIRLHFLFAATHRSIDQGIMNCSEQLGLCQQVSCPGVTLSRFVVL